jgi:hypothetical protein
VTVDINPEQVGVGKMIDREFEFSAKRFSIATVGHTKRKKQACSDRAGFEFEHGAISLTERTVSLIIPGVVSGGRLPVAHPFAHG